MQALLAALLLGAATVLPKSAVIVPVAGAGALGSDAVGNVKVTFTDGHTEMWTKQGRALMAQVSSTGLVGWATFTTRYETLPIDDTLRICWPDEHDHDFKAGTADGHFPFINDWNFTPDGTHVIIKSRAMHGPAYYLLYDTASGKMLDHAGGDGTTGRDLPWWAQPYSD
jgi:hypothetical protein